MSTVNFPNSPSNGQTLTTNTGITYTYNSAKSRWDATTGYVTASALDNYVQVANTASFATTGQLDNYLQVANSSSGVTAYSDISDLPLSGQTTGKLAYVTGSNRLYLWAGSGWYNIALVNTDPSISGAQATYSLDGVNGSNTVVTLASTDPEGIPITFSLSTSGLGVGANAIATITQSNNIFTFTPTTNTALAGTFTATFTASDGVNLAVANSSFTLAFTVNNSNYTTALITSVGANLADNNNFVDASPSSTTLTAYQDAHMTSFSPYRQGGYSTYFDGSGDYLTVASSTEHDFGTGNFCVEFWWWPETVTGQSYHIAISAAQNTTTQIGYDEGTRKLYFYNGSNIIQNTSATPNVKAWNHIAVSRSGTTVSLYLNGTRVGTATYSANVSLSGAQIGRYHGGGYEIDGYVRDVRFVKGSDVYDATQTSITVPTEPLTAITNTTLLACHLPYLRDGSTNVHSLGVAGNVATRPFSPYDVDQYNAATDGGSIRITSSGDYVGFQNGTDFEFDGDFTVACWVYFESETGHNSIFSISDAGNDGFCQMGSDRLLLRNTAGGTTIIDSSAYQIPANRWTHVALTRSGSDIKFFLNGTVTLTATSSVTISEISSVEGTIGRRVNSANIGYFFGNIADLYVKKGTADYTAAFTPPLTPASSTGTVLHVKGTDASIIDKSQSVKTVILNGDVKSSTTQTKYLSSSMYFDGTGDYIVANGLALGSAVFTVEFWMRGSDVNPGSNFRIIEQSTGSFAVDIGSSGKIRAHYNGGNFKTNTGVLTQDTWHHVAVVREGTGTNEAKIYIDGTLEATGTLGDDYTDTVFEIGGNSSYYTGYLSDLRITKGLARYTSSFTPPTAALEG